MQLRKSPQQVCVFAMDSGRFYFGLQPPDNFLLPTSCIEYLSSNTPALPGIGIGAFFPAPKRLWVDSDASNCDVY